MAGAHSRLLSLPLPANHSVLSGELQPTCGITNKTKPSMTLLKPLTLCSLTEIMCRIQLKDQFSSPKAGNEGQCSVTAREEGARRRLISRHGPGHRAPGSTADPCSSCPHPSLRPPGHVPSMRTRTEATGTARRTHGDHLLTTANKGPA